jgi:hypothetical protein
VGPSLFQEPTVDSENRINHGRFIRGNFIRGNLTPRPLNVKTHSPLIEQGAIVFDVGMIPVDWEGRLDPQRMLRERLQRAKDALKNSDLDALFVFRTEDARYLMGYRHHLGSAFIMGTRSWCWHATASRSCGRVNAIAPTATLSENTQRHLQQNPARAERLLSRIKLGRFAEPADLAGAALFLASPASDFITGHTLFVDGGWHAGG